MGNNAEVLADILTLHVPSGGLVLDLTYSTGRFWRGPHRDRYMLLTNDLYSGHADFAVDFREAAAHFPSASFDAVVLDPPYSARNADGKPLRYKESTIDKYTQGLYGTRTSHTNWLDGVVGETDLLYIEGAAQARQLLKPKGVLILKTQDEIRSGHFVPKGLQFLKLDGFLIADLFVVVAKRPPATSSKWTGPQQHARKNHSYFLVHRPR